MKKIISILLYMCLPFSAHAGFFKLNGYNTYGPFESSTQNPLFLHFLQVPLDKVPTTAKKNVDVSLSTNFTNMFEQNLPPTGYGIDLDMELVRNAIKVKYGLTNKLELGAEIPFIGFFGGFLDSFIQNYHNAFGFPNAGRNTVPNGRFSYRVNKNGSSVYNVNKTLFGLGDIVLSSKLHLIDEGKRRFGIAFKGLLKLPTGSISHGTGSGYPDVGVSILAQKSYKRLTSYSQMGVVILGGHRELKEITRAGSLFFNQGFEINVTKHCSWVTQLDGQTSYYGYTGLKELSGMSLNLVNGLEGSWDLKHKIKKINYRVSLSEDLIPSGPAVDFTVSSQIGLGF
ncbi:DUF3187 family protein [bacterium]|nr:DUF3187 family protein [bacterium]